MEGEEEGRQVFGYMMMTIAIMSGKRDREILYSSPFLTLFLSLFPSIYLSFVIEQVYYTRFGFHGDLYGRTALNVLRGADYIKRKFRVLPCTYFTNTVILFSLNVDFPLH